LIGDAAFHDRVVVGNPEGTVPVLLVTVKPVGIAYDREEGLKSTPTVNAPIALLRLFTPAYTYNSLLGVNSHACPVPASGSPLQIPLDPTHNLPASKSIATIIFSPAL
jgi:hypothetical protein